MYEILKRNWDKAKFILLSGFIIIFLLLLTVVYKSDEKITKISENNKNSYDVSDLKAFKQFILDQIKSPFTNIDYEIKKGDFIGFDYYLRALGEVDFIGLLILSVILFLASSLIRGRLRPYRVCGFVVAAAIGMGGDPYFGPGIETVMSKEYNELDETIVKNPEDIDYNRMIKATKEVIYDISQLGKVLIISRGASAILKDQDNTLRIFFISNFERRIEIAKNIHNVTSNDEAEEILKHADHAQNEYYIKAFGLDFDDMSMYHSVLNTSALEVETCSEVVLALAKSNLRI